MAVPRVNTAPHGVETPIWGSQSQRPAPSGRYMAQSPESGQRSFNTSTTPTNRGRQRWSPWSIPTRTVSKPQPHWLIADLSGVREATDTRAVYDPILGTKHILYIYDFKKSGTKAVIPPDYIAPYGVETPTVGTPLLAGVREAGGLQHLEVKRFSKFICHDLIDLHNIFSCELHSTCNMDYHLNGLRVAQPIKTIRIQGLKYHVQYVKQKAQQLRPLQQQHCQLHHQQVTVVAVGMYVQQ